MPAQLLHTRTSGWTMSQQDAKRARREATQTREEELLEQVCRPHDDDDDKANTINLMQVHLTNAREERDQARVIGTDLKMNATGYAAGILFRMSNMK